MFFSASMVVIMYLFFPFEFVYIVDYVGRFSYIVPTLHLWHEAYLIFVNNGIDVFLDLVCENFIDNFCLYIHKENWSEVLYLCWVFMWFRYQSNCGFIE